jgi:hypothetical protein
MSAKQSLITGGCYCGRVRYSAGGETIARANCHCRNCRRAVGAQAVAWITVRLSRFRYEKGMPTRYKTDTGAWRTFCKSCGTSLTYEHDSRPGEIDVTTASLDQPEDFAPTKDVFADEKLSWVELVEQKKSRSVDPI